MFWWYNLWLWKIMVIFNIFWYIIKENPLLYISIFTVLNVTSLNSSGPLLKLKLDQDIKIYCPSCHRSVFWINKNKRIRQVDLKLIERIKDCKDYLLFSWSLTISCPSLLSEPLLCFLRPCSCAVGTGSPLHYSALHSHQGRMTMSSPGLHSRVHSPISNMAALR